MECFCFTKRSTEELGYVRSATLMSLSFFNVNKMDTSRILTALESIDTTATSRVDVEAFATVYCSEYSTIFKFVWELYEPLVRNNNSNGKTSTADLKEKQPQFNIFIAFLFFVICSPANDLPLIIYWLWFVKPQRPVTIEGGKFRILSKFVLKRSFFWF